MGLKIFSPSFLCLCKQLSTKLNTSLQIMIRDVLIIVNRAKIHTEVCKNSNNRELNDTLFVQENVKVTKKNITCGRDGHFASSGGMKNAACGDGHFRVRRWQTPQAAFGGVACDVVCCCMSRGCQLPFSERNLMRTSLISSSVYSSSSSANSSRASSMLLSSASRK